MDILTAFGLFAVTAMVVTYAFERNPGYLSICRGVRLGFALWVSARRLAVRPRRSNLGVGGGTSLVAERAEVITTAFRSER